MDKITLETYEDVKTTTDSMRDGFKWLAWMGQSTDWSGYDAERICEELNNLHHEAVAFRKWHERA